MLEFKLLPYITIDLHLLFSLRYCGFDLGNISSKLPLCKSNNLYLNSVERGSNELKNIM